MKPVRYSLLQQSLDVPGIEQLKRAFTSVRCLVDSDAHGVANDAYGILVRDLDAEDAHRLQGALRVEGVETELVAMPLLPSIPPTKYVRRIQFGPDVLLIYDPIGRPVPIEWRHLMLIAAGNVLMNRLARRAVPGSAADLLTGSSAWNLGGDRSELGAARTEVREERGLELTLELVLTNGVARFSLESSAPVIFRCLGERQTNDLGENFRLLVHDLAQAAPKAMLNRGAWFLRQSPPTLFEYPSKNAFFEEIIWMMHRARFGLHPVCNRSTC